MTENILESLNKDLNGLKAKQTELTGQLDQARQDQEAEKALSGAALLRGETMEKSSAGLIKAADKLTVLTNALEQIAANIKAKEADIKAEALKADTLAMNELGKKAKNEADQIAGDLTKTIYGLGKLQTMFEEAMLLQARNFAKLTRASSLQAQPGNLIPFALNLLAQIAQATDNEKCINALNEIEEKSHYVRA